MSVTDFLLARIEEDERAASESLLPLEGAGFSSQARRALAECDAKRQILHIHDQTYAKWGGFYFAPSRPRYCVSDRETAPCSTIKVLAALYETHPDYDEHWRP